MNIVKRISTPLAMVVTQRMLEAVKEYSEIELYPAEENNRIQLLECLKDIVLELFFLAGINAEWEKYVSIQYSKEHVYVVVDSDFEEKTHVIKKLEWLLSVLNMKYYKKETWCLDEDKNDMVTDALMRYSHLAWDIVRDNQGRERVRSDEKRVILFKFIAEFFFEREDVLDRAINILEDFESQNLFQIAPNIKLGRLQDLLKRLNQVQAMQG